MSFIYKLNSNIFNESSILMAKNAVLVRTKQLKKGKVMVSVAHKFRAVWCLLFLSLTACAQSTPGDRMSIAPTPTPILVFGDSLSAGLRVDQNQRWSVLMEQRLKEEGVLRANQSVANFSVSGETSAGGLQRLEAILDETQPVVLVLQLGANDALRRQSMQALHTNLSKMIEMAIARNIRVVLVGVEPPILFSFASTSRFTDVYEDLAKQYDVILVPDLFDKLSSKNMQEDRLHPNTSGQSLMMETMHPSLIEASRF